MLAKSTQLNKRVLDMNQHYLELQTFLAEVKCYPETAMDRSLQVYPSEERLYGIDKRVNYRLPPLYEPIEEMIFSKNETDEDIHFFIHFIHQNGCKTFIVCREPTTRRQVLAT